MTHKFSVGPLGVNHDCQHIRHERKVRWRESLIKLLLFLRAGFQGLSAGDNLLYREDSVPDNGTRPRDWGRTPLGGVFGSGTDSRRGSMTHSGTFWRWL